MRGGRTHNDGIVKPAAELARRAGFPCWPEYPACNGRGAIDLVICTPQGLVGWEAELRPDRVHADIAKALAVGASHLFVVTPGSAMAARCRLRMAAVPVPPGLRVCVQPFGLAIRGLSDLLAELMFTESSISNSNNNPSMGSRTTPFTAPIGRWGLGSSGPNVPRMQTGATE